MSQLSGFYWNLVLAFFSLTISKKPTIIFSSFEESLGRLLHTISRSQSYLFFSKYLVGERALSSRGPAMQPYLRKHFFDDV